MKKDGLDGRSFEFGIFLTCAGKPSSLLAGAYSNLASPHKSNSLGFRVCCSKSTMSWVMSTFRKRGLLQVLFMKSGSNLEGGSIYEIFQDLSYWFSHSVR